MAADADGPREAAVALRTCELTSSEYGDGGDARPSASRGLRRSPLSRGSTTPARRWPRPSPVRIDDDAEAQVGLWRVV